jgi:hypothetical protein
MAAATPSTRNPFVYGRVLQIPHAACPRPVYETAIIGAARSSGRLAFVGDRRLGKSTLVERTLAKAKEPLLRWDFHQILSMDDIVRRAAEEFDVFVRNLRPVARRITPWLREIGLGIENLRVSYHGAGATLRVGAPTDHLKRLLGYVAQVASRRKLCFFIDELQEVRDRLPKREGDAVLGILRSEIQRLDVPCFFAGSARESFRGIFVSEASPFYDSARLLEVESIPGEDFNQFLREQFSRGGRKLSLETADLLLSLGGSSPNDVQHLAHETWNTSSAGPVGALEIHVALSKILSDIAPMGEAWLEQLTKRQARTLLAIALFNHLPATSEEFLRIAGLRNPGGLSSALRPCMHGHEPIVEKLGKAYRVRSRYLRIWLSAQRHIVQELIPMMRDQSEYLEAFSRVCPIGRFGTERARETIPSE